MRTPRLAILIVLLACVESFAQTKPAPPPPAVAQGKDGKLVYATDQQGNRVVDFSNCGYMGGDAEIPSFAVRVTVPHKPGDATARIQAALDHVASLPAE